MKVRIAILILTLGFSAARGQQTASGEPAENQIDSLYLEDQFYVGLSYNLLLDRPEGVSQNNLSYGILFGFIKDMPINRERTLAIGVGLGYGVNSYYSNLRALRNGDDYQYAVLSSADSYKRNKIETHLIELPVQFRWRNSTPTDYSFWRIYAGFKLGYVVGSRSKFVTSEFKDSFYNTDTENFRYGLTLNVGYNTINFHVYYGLNNLFESGVQGPGDGDLNMIPLRVGLMFYIL
ncbi:porin family protein [Robiginitalea sp. SC105]|uniref:porin family protein n=1 Tax=Robiginitalea sp. SC105 TaxID=2762332 RepID=UPI002104AA0B|nr:porin family protein [Robiginitalea sp. SC105]